jgi:hypothetical protein
VAEEEIALRVALKDRQVASREMGLLKRDVADLGDTTIRTGDQAERSARGWSKLDGGLGALRRKAVLVGGALAVAGAAGGKALFGATQKASDLSETVGKVNQIFGGAQGSALAKWAKGAATSMGQSQQAALDGVATFGVFGKSAGLTGKELAGFAKEQSRLASDLASFGNTTPEEAIGALGAAFRGEAEPMRKFGVLLDDATLRQEALRLGLVKSTKDALTPQQKVLAAQASIMKQTKDAQGDFQRTSGGLANQQRILAAQFENVQATVGKALLPVFTRVVTVVNKSIIPAVKTFIGQMKSGEGVGGRFAQVFGTVRDALSRIAGVIRGALSGSAGDASTYLGHIVDTFRSVVSIVQSLWDRFGGTITRYTQATFQNLKTVIGGALKVISGIFKTVAALLKGDWSGAWNGIKQIASGAVAMVKGIVKQLWNFIRSAFSIGMSAVKGLFSGMWDGLKSLASRGIDGIVGFVRRLPGRIVSVASGAFDGLKNAFRSAVNFIIDGWNGLSFSIPGFDPPGPGKIPGVTISTPNIPRLAKGGIVQATPGGTLAVIGEGGRDEAVIPLPQPMSLSAPDVSLDDVPGLAAAAPRQLVVPVYLDRTQIGEAVLDDFERRAARR